MGTCFLSFLHYCLSLWMVGTSTSKERVRDYDRLVDFALFLLPCTILFLLLAQIVCLNGSNRSSINMNGWKELCKVKSFVYRKSIWLKATKNCTNQSQGYSASERLNATLNS